MQLTIWLPTVNQYTNYENNAIFATFQYLMLYYKKLNKIIIKIEKIIL